MISLFLSIASHMYISSVHFILAQFWELVHRLSVRHWKNICLSYSCVYEYVCVICQCLSQILARSSEGRILRLLVGCWRCVIYKLFGGISLIYLVLHAHFEKHFLLCQVLLLRCRWRSLVSLQATSVCILSCKSPTCLSFDLLHVHLLLVVLCCSLLSLSLCLSLRLQLLILLNFLHKCDLLLLGDAGVRIFTPLQTCTTLTRHLLLRAACLLTRMNLTLVACKMWIGSWVCSLGLLLLRDVNSTVRVCIVVRIPIRIQIMIGWNSANSTKPAHLSRTSNSNSRQNLVTSRICCTIIIYPNRFPQFFGSVVLLLLYMMMCLLTSTVAPLD